jgi:CRP-like cAMP-binding protein/Fe-S-cluster-containing hydrogenase component 2
MSHIVVNPEVDLPPRPGDEHLPSELLEQLELFRGLKKTPSFDKFPGSAVLRRYQAGEVICRQGDAGASAFYILTTADLFAVRRQQLAHQENAAAQARLAQQVAALEQQQARLAAEPPSENALRRLTAYLMLADAPTPRGWLASLWGPRRSVHFAPQSIPIDAPSEVDYNTRRAPLLEGEVFGEMSCMTMSPRSATVVADGECYLLEFLRNIFDHIQRDAGYQARLEAVYRERILKNHLKRIDVLADLPPAELEHLHEHAELVRAEPGQVIFDQGDVADAVYLIRAGLVQVVTDPHVVLRESDVADWNVLIQLIQSGSASPPAKAPPSPVENPALDASAEGVAKPKSAAEMLAAAKAKTSPPMLSPLAHLWQALDAATQAAVQAYSEHAADDAGARQLVVAALNARVRDRKWLAAKALAPVAEQPAIVAATRAFPKGMKGLEKDWTDLEVRIGGRLILDQLLAGGLSPRAAHAGPPRVLSYLSRGDVFGEIGVLTNTPRSATCLAYDHPPDPKRSSVPVDLVRIPAAAFQDLLARSSTLRARVERIVAERRARDVQRAQEKPWDANQAILSSPEFQELGLIQGQKLLLIDLDRCTRCGDCVTACVNTHGDGRSRLFLDGPRFDRYLVPSACRNCLNPACMIGCPVGSIQRGEDGQILIRDWCIGCGMCANQCPYDSIQMHDLGLLPQRAMGWEVTPLSATSRWPPTGALSAALVSSPFAWDLALQAQLARRNLQSGATLETAVGFRYEFHVASEDRRGDARHELILVTQGASAAVWLNGQALELTCEEKQRRGENQKLTYGCLLDSTHLRRGRNLLAVRVEPPVAAGDVVLDVRIAPAAGQMQLGPGQAAAEVRQVAEQAVVCDLCSALPTGPACVTMCPHDAALRVDARFEFPGA